MTIDFAQYDWRRLVNIPSSIDWYGKELNVSVLNTDILNVYNYSVYNNITSANKVITPYLQSLSNLTIEADGCIDFPVHIAKTQNKWLSFCDKRFLFGAYVPSVVARGSGITFWDTNNTDGNIIWMTTPLNSTGQESIWWVDNVGSGSGGIMDYPSSGIVFSNKGVVAANEDLYLYPTGNTMPYLRLNNIDTSTVVEASSNLTISANTTLFITAPTRYYNATSSEESVRVGTPDIYFEQSTYDLGYNLGVSNNIVSNADSTIFGLGDKSRGYGTIIFTGSNSSADYFAPSMIWYGWNRTGFVDGGKSLTMYMFVEKFFSITPRLIFDMAGMESLVWQSSGDYEVRVNDSADYFRVYSRDGTSLYIYPQTDKVNFVSLQDMAFGVNNSITFYGNLYPQSKINFDLSADPHIVTPAQNLTIDPYETLIVEGNVISTKSDSEENMSKFGDGTRYVGMGVWNETGVDGNVILSLLTYNGSSYFSNDIFGYSDGSMKFEPEKNTTFDSTGNGAFIFEDNVIMKGNLTLENTVWDDERVPVTMTKLGGTNDPDFIKAWDNGAGSQGVFTYAFDNALEEELYFNLQIPHGYKSGTNFRPHVHFFNKNNNAGNIVWGLEYNCINLNGTFSGTTTLTTVTIANGGTNKHSYAEFPEIVGTNFGASTICSCRVYRAAANAADTYASDSYLLEIDFHFQKDKLGTDAEYG